MALVHSHNIVIRPSETNQLGLLRTDSTANYMEDIATEHATLLGVGLRVLLKHNLSWAMSKMRINFHRRPRSGESLTLLTRPLVGQHHTYLREFFFADETGQTSITALTWWVAFDLSTRKMSSLPDALNSFPQGEKSALESAITVPSIKKHSNPFAGPDFSIRHADIDQNNHVNNVRYLSFVEEAGFLYNPQAVLQQVELVFRAESQYGDLISTTSVLEKAIPPQYTLLHSLYSGSREQLGELLRGRTVWMEETN